MTMNVNNYAHVNTVKPEKDIYSIYLPGIITKKPSLSALSIIFTNLWKNANYLIKYARYKNVPSRNGFYGKSYLRNIWEKFGSDEYQIVGVLALSNMPASKKWAS